MKELKIELTGELRSMIGRITNRKLGELSEKQLKDVTIAVFRLASQACQNEHRLYQV